ncbi:MAG TPA: YkgJ family cysteine cluster protein [Vicinamibacterales bacterium]|nr:YkgJ family cysteine cluster protein [Vicinamibacterales bacterium]
MRIDPNQRFACSQCGRCCHRFDVVVSPGEIDLYRRREAATWFREANGVASDREPFEPIPGMPALRRIRKRADGGCGFLTADNRCRIHQELGAAKKPLTCRLFPYAFHAAADGTVVTASFGCPTIVANEGPLIGTGELLAGIESLRKEWVAIHPPLTAPLQLVHGRNMETRTLRQVRENLLAMLNRDSADIRDDIRRIAAAFDDLTRSRVVALSDEDFAEYISLTLPHAAAKQEAPPRREPGAIARMLQYGFLYTVTAIRADLEHPGQSRGRLRMLRLHLLAHFHGLAPAVERVNVKALKRRRVDINDPHIRPIVFHYLRSTFETLGARNCPLLDEVSIAASYLNAACSLAVMNAAAAGKDLDRATFIEALTEASDTSHARNALLDWILGRFSGGTDALWNLAA